MKPTITTRRNVIKGAGAAGIAGIVSASSGASASAHDQTEGSDNGEDANGNGDDDDHFAAVRVGNLVPDIAVTEDGGGPPSDSPGEGRGPPSTPPGLNGPHAPTSTAGDLYVGKRPDRNPTIGEVYYPTFGPGAGDAYLQVPAREYNIFVARSGTVDPLFEEDVTVEAGSRYTALAIGSVSTEDSEDLQPLIIEDAESRAEATPSETHTEVSFVHASPNAGAVDIVVGGVPLFEDVEFGAVTDYLSVPPDEYTVEIQSNGQTVLELTRELVEATRLTVYVTGFAGIDEFPDEDGRFGLSAVATIDGLNPQPRNVLTR